MNLTKDEQTYLYNLATKRFIIGDYKNAIACYQYLILCDNANPIYSKSLASCCQKQGKYSIAYMYYRLSYTINNTDVECLFYSAVCLFYMQEYTKSLEAFNEYICINKGANVKLEKRAEDYMHTINNHIKQFNVNL